MPAMASASPDLKVQSLTYGLESSCPQSTEGALMTVLNRLKLRQKIALLFGTFLLIALLITHLIVQSVERISSTSAWTAHTFEVLDQLRIAEVALVRQEMELRDFLLAPSHDVVQSYWQTAYSTSFAKAKELTVDNPAQQVQLDEMN